MAETSILGHEVKALEKIRFRPMYDGANMERPSRAHDLGLGEMHE
jgi:hypothetical protein